MKNTQTVLFLHIQGNGGVNKEIQRLRQRIHLMGIPYDRCWEMAYRRLTAAQNDVTVPDIQT